MAAAAAGTAGAIAGVPLVTGPAGSTKSSRYGIVGHRAPELDVKSWIDADGKPTMFKLGHHHGKWVILKCFQFWCPGCHSHGFPSLQRISAAFQNDPRVAIAGIQTVFEGFSSNSEDAVRKLQLRYNLRIPMGHDAGSPNGDYLPGTMRRYRTGGTPWIIIIDREGIVVFNDFHVKPEAVIAHFGSI